MVFILGIEGSANKLGIGIITDQGSANDLANPFILSNPRVTYITPTGTGNAHPSLSFEFPLLLAWILPLQPVLGFLPRATAQHHHAHILKLVSFFFFKRNQSSKNSRIAILLGSAGAG